MVAGLKPVLQCAEGEEITITAEYIYATDPDSDSSSLAVLIARQPNHGVVLRNGVVVDRFIQADITAGIISYRHTGTKLQCNRQSSRLKWCFSDPRTMQWDSVSTTATWLFSPPVCSKSATSGVIAGLEIGLTPRDDTITFVISDEETESSAFCCSGLNAIKSGTRLRDSLPLYDLHVTVFPVDNQPPSLATGDVNIQAESTHP